MDRARIQIWLSAIVILSSVACAQATPITVIVTATPTDMPQPTATPFPLDQLDIASLLVQDGDLPAGFSGAQIRDEAPGMFSECPVPALAAFQQFAKDEETAGGVTVLLYESPEDIADVYALITDGMTLDTAYEGISANTRETSEVGDRALVLAMSTTILDNKSEFLDLCFTRCQALVHVRLSGTLSEDAIIAYGKRLDSRLQPVVCQE